jgi:uncharacterized membrane protein YedE/YeeE
MKANLAAFAAGVVFAIGLCIAGMTLPSKIVGFLDFAGQWDASLALVIAGAVAVYAVIYSWAAGQEAPLLVPKFSIPSRNDIDGSLIGGAALFGIGWGLGGFCPGPAIAALAWAASPVIIFVVAMCVGMYLHAWISTAALGRTRNATAASVVMVDA